MVVNVVLDDFQVREGEREEHIPSHQGDAGRQGLVLLPNAFQETQFLFPQSNQTKSGFRQSRFCFHLD